MLTCGIHGGSVQMDINPQLETLLIVYLLPTTEICAVNNIHLYKKAKYICTSNFNSEITRSCIHQKSQTQI